MDPFKPEYSDYTYRMTCKIVEQSLKKQPMLPDVATNKIKISGKEIQPWTVIIGTKTEQRSAYIRHALDLSHAKKRMKDIIHSGRYHNPSGEIIPLVINLKEVQSITIESQSANVTYSCVRNRRTKTGWKESITPYTI